MAMTGQTFSPANSQASGGPSGSAPTLQDAIRLLSFRLPTNVGASAPAAPGLLGGGSQGAPMGGGMPGATESWLQTLFGGGGGQQLPPFLAALQERIRAQGGMPGAPGGMPGGPGPMPGGGGQAPPPVFQFPYPGQGPGIPLDPNQGGGSFPGPQTQPYRPVPQGGGGQNYPGGSPSFNERGPMLGQPGPFSERGPFLG